MSKFEEWIPTKFPCFISYLFQSTILVSNPIYVKIIGCIPWLYTGTTSVFVNLAYLLDFAYTTPLASGAKAAANSGKISQRSYMDGDLLVKVGSLLSHSIFLPCSFQKETLATIGSDSKILKPPWQLSHPLSFRTCEDCPWLGNNPQQTHLRLRSLS